MKDMETLINFSQSKEDVILFHALKDVKKNDIFWIDVGANDPINISVTLLFSILGARGINIEPQEMYRSRYEKLRERDINLYVGISDQKGQMVLYGSGDTATMCEGGLVALKSTIEVITLTEVFEKYVPNDQEVHFLKIDVEGAEEKCIRGLDLSKYKPWIILIECLPSETHDGYESLLVNNGYCYVFYDGQNRYYVREDKESILKRFETGEMGELEKYYEIISFQDVTKYLSYEQSTSWKVTAPLRKVGSFLKNLKK